MKKITVLLLFVSTFFAAFAQTWSGEKVIIKNTLSLRDKNIQKFSTDTTLSDNNDSTIASVKALRAFMANHGGAGGADGNNYTYNLQYNSQTFRLSRTGLSDLTVVIDKTGLGLPLVDNTADSSKPVSTPQFQRIKDSANNKVRLIFKRADSIFVVTNNGVLFAYKDSVNAAGTGDGNNYVTSITYTGQTLRVVRTGLADLVVTIDKTGIGLPLVDNTPDVSKPVSALQQQRIADSAFDKIRALYRSHDSVFAVMTKGVFFQFKDSVGAAGASGTDTAHVAGWGMKKDISGRTVIDRLDSMLIITWLNANHPYFVYGDTKWFRFSPMHDTIYFNESNLPAVSSVGGPYYANIDSMKLYKPANGSIGFTNEYHTDYGAISGARYQYNATSTATADDKTILGSGTGRWVLTPNNGNVGIAQLGVQQGGDLTATINATKGFVCSNLYSFFHEKNRTYVVNPGTGIGLINYWSYVAEDSATSVLTNAYYTGSGKSWFSYADNTFTTPVVNPFFKGVHFVSSQTFTNRQISTGVPQDTTSNFISVIYGKNLKVQDCHFENGATQSAIFYYNLDTVVLSGNTLVNLGGCFVKNFFGGDSSLYLGIFKNNINNGLYNVYDGNSPAGYAKYRKGDNAIAAAAKRMVIDHNYFKQLGRWFVGESFLKNNAEYFFTNNTIDGNNSNNAGLSTGGDVLTFGTLADTVMITGNHWIGENHNHQDATDSLFGLPLYIASNLQEHSAAKHFIFSYNDAPYAHFSLARNLKGEIYKNNFLSPNSDPTAESGTANLFASEGSYSQGSINVKVHDNTIVWGNGQLMNFGNNNMIPIDTFLMTNNDVTLIGTAAIGNIGLDSAGNVPHIFFKNNTQFKGNVFTAFYTNGFGPSIPIDFTNNNLTNTNISAANLATVTGTNPTISLSGNFNSLLRKKPSDTTIVQAYTGNGYNDQPVIIPPASSSGSPQTLDQTLSQGNTTAQGITSTDSIKVRAMNAKGSLKVGDTTYPITAKATFFGTSITAGYGLVNLTDRYSHETIKAFSVIEDNQGHSGSWLTYRNPSDQSMISQLPLVPRYDSTQNFMMFLEYGANDALGGIDTGTFKTAYNLIIDTILARGWPARKIMIVGEIYSTAVGNAQAFSIVERNIAAGKGVRFCETYNYMFARGGAALLQDGLHPNTKGAYVIAQALTAAIASTETYSGTGEYRGDALADRNLTVIGGTNLNQNLTVNGDAFIGHHIINPPANQMVTIENPYISVGGQYGGISFVPNRINTVQTDSFSFRHLVNSYAHPDFGLYFDNNQIWNYTDGGYGGRPAFSFFGGQIGSNRYSFNNGGVAIADSVTVLGKVNLPALPNGTGADSLISISNGLVRKVPPPASGSGSGPWSLTSNDIYSNNSGNVGIGTNTPSNKLSVVGNVSIAGNNGISGSLNLGGHIISPTVNVMQTFENPYITTGGQYGGISFVAHPLNTVQTDSFSFRHVVQTYANPDFGFFKNNTAKWLYTSSNDAITIGSNNFAVTNNATFNGPAIINNNLSVSNSAIINQLAVGNNNPFFPFIVNKTGADAGSGNFRINGFFGNYNGSKGMFIGYDTSSASGDGMIGSLAATTFMVYNGSAWAPAGKFSTDKKLTVFGGLNLSGLNVQPVDTSAYKVAVVDASNNVTKMYWPSSGLTNPMTTSGDLIVGGTGGTPTRLATGTAGQHLGGGNIWRDTLLVSSGPYTPTIGNTTNVSASSLGSAYYTRIGNIVTVTVNGSITPSSGGSVSLITIDLPFTTATGTQSGAGNGVYSIGTTAYVPGVCFVNSTTTAEFRFYPTTTNLEFFNLSFTYKLN